MCCSMLQCVAVCCSVLQCAAECYSVLQSVRLLSVGVNVIVYYGVALVSRIDKIIGLFCKRDLLKRRYSAKETYNFIDPTDRSYPIQCKESYYEAKFVRSVDLWFVTSLGTLTCGCATRA